MSSPCMAVTVVRYTPAMLLYSKHVVHIFLIKTNQVSIHICITMFRDNYKRHPTYPGLLNDVELNRTGHEEEFKYRYLNIEFL